MEGLLKTIGFHTAENLPEIESIAQDPAETHKPAILENILRKTYLVENQFSKFFVQQS